MKINTRLPPSEVPLLGAVAVLTGAELGAEQSERTGIFYPPVAQPGDVRDLTSTRRREPSCLGCVDWGSAVYPVSRPPFQTVSLRKLPKYQDSLLSRFSDGVQRLSRGDVERRFDRSTNVVTP